MGERGMPADTGVVVVSWLLLGLVATSCTAAAAAAGSLVDLEGLKDDLTEVKSFTRGT